MSLKRPKHTSVHGTEKALSLSHAHTTDKQNTSKSLSHTHAHIESMGKARFLDRYEFRLLVLNIEILPFRAQIVASDSLMTCLIHVSYSSQRFMES